MPKLPEPPPRGGLTSLRPAERILKENTLLWRIYFLGGSYPTAWDEFRAWGPKKDARFDHHLPPPRLQARKILYAATRIYTCFAEAFQASRTIDRTVRAPRLVGFETARPIRLLDLMGTWPTQAGASMAINTGRRDRARRWSLRIYEDYPNIEGLLYPSSMDSNQAAVALYERAEPCLPSRPTFDRALADPAVAGVVARAANTFGYDVEP